jgi:hypothetical protein
LLIERSWILHQKKKLKTHSSEFWSWHYLALGRNKMGGESPITNPMFLSITDCKTGYMIYVDEVL